MWVQSDRPHGILTMKEDEMLQTIDHWSDTRNMRLRNNERINKLVRRERVFEMFRTKKSGRGGGGMLWCSVYPPYINEPLSNTQALLVSVCQWGQSIMFLLRGGGGQREGELWRQDGSQREHEIQSKRVINATFHFPIWPPPTHWLGFPMKGI